MTADLYFDCRVRWWGRVADDKTAGERRSGLA